MNISIIVPVYNVEKYIERCLRSIMNQTHTEGVECILINDCTPDNSIKIAEKLIHEYKGNISFRIISHEQNRGIATVRNTGIKEAQGTYIQYIDSDDYIDSNMLYEMYNEAIKTDADIVITDYYDTFRQKEIRNVQKIPSDVHEILSHLLQHQISWSIRNKLYKKEIFIRNNIVLPENIFYGEDLLLNVFVLHYTKKVSYIPKAYYHYVQYNTQSYTYNGFNAKTISDIIKRTEIITDFFKKVGITPQIHQSFIFHKIDYKFKLIAATKGKEQAQICSLYPETNEYIFKSHITNIKKILLWLAIHHGLFLFNIALSINKLKQKFQHSHNNE